MSQRPRFEPIPCDPAKEQEPLHSGWIPLIRCAADFPPEIFEVAVIQLIHHPEYNSTLILRSEVIADTTSNFQQIIPQLQERGLAPRRCIHRRLLPRRPGRDPPLEQYCTLYAPISGPDTDTVTTLVLTPIVDAQTPLPYYHPTVSHLAFRYSHLFTDSNTSDTPTPTLIIEVDPYPNTPLDPSSRLYRTCLALLDTVHRYGWGAMINYKKRVNHDVLIGREEYQDLYLVMRERHKGLVGTWQEVTDPLKHVFEDIGIATYLMLLWKQTFSPSPTPPSLPDIDTQGSEPWHSWPQPPGGFLDLGCGNGLLTHILTAEGYQGYGIDLRARTSWAHYPPSTQAALRVHAFDPTVEASDCDTEKDEYFKPGVWIIGNHADELTPWVPVLATLCKASGYLSIPCCAWAFDGRFVRSGADCALYPLPVVRSSQNECHEGEDGTEERQQSVDEFAETLNLGGDGTKSSYSQYRIWLASLSLYCGWEVETEVLRIPSTRNWGIIGRKRLENLPPEESLDRVKDIIEDVKRRGAFKTRRPEGKAGDH